MSASGQADKGRDDPIPSAQEIEQAFRALPRAAMKDRCPDRPMVRFAPPDAFRVPRSAGIAFDPLDKVVAAIKEFVLFTKNDSAAK